MAEKIIIINRHIGMVIRQLREQEADWKLQKSQKGRVFYEKLRRTGRSGREYYQRTYWACD